jgi:hypothetical protein
MNCFFCLSFFSSKKKFNGKKKLIEKFESLDKVSIIIFVTKSGKGKLRTIPYSSSLSSFFSSSFQEQGTD